MAQQLALDAPSSPRSAGDWRRSYARRLLLTDAIALAWVVFGTEIFRLGAGSTAGVALGPAARHPQGVSYSAISLTIIAAWLAALSLSGTRFDRVVGTGSAEYVRVVTASTRLFGAIAIVAFLTKLDLARGYVLIAFPLGTLVLLLTRWIWRQWLQLMRDEGAFSSRVLLVGPASSAAATAAELNSLPHAGYRVVGACLPSGSDETALTAAGIPVVLGFDDVVGAMRRAGADTVVITSSEQLPNDRVRRIGWALEPGREHLVVAPGIIDVGGPRIHVRPVAGLPLMHVETPQYGGAKLAVKRSFDLVLAALAAAALSPVLAAIAIAVVASSPGPALFAQERIGLNGETFRMLKFRSMVQDAEQRLAALQRLQRREGNAVLFKMKDDPRITRIGRLLRRYSLDELPQLFNVIGGSMSLVGPRPSLERELELYEEHTHRRFLVKPGITGLWQVSGRSNLTWEESVRLDLYYVENWSLTGDLSILLRTTRAVFARDGAY